MWDIGYGYGVMGNNWVQMVNDLREELNRFLAGWERAELAHGWRAGQADRETYWADMEAGADVPAACEEALPF